MDYFVLKAINNNVVLAKNSKTDEQVILMSKGIGFNRKVNDQVSDSGEENQIFKLWSNGEEIKDFTYDKNELKLVVTQIAEIAQEKLGLSKNDLINPLLDHITFLADRINFGLYIDNPFQNEISILYANEYEIAKYAVDLIKERIGIDAGESEIGLITLHLNSAIQKRPLSTSLDQVRIYNKISNVISNGIGNGVLDNFLDIRIFLMTLDKLVKTIQNGIHLQMNIEKAVSKSMPLSYKIAMEIAELIKIEMKIHLNDSDTGFIAIDIEKLRQLNIRREG
ncbi:MAG: PRD domain-containing protein [Oscillospiraceae bacterium]